MESNNSVGKERNPNATQSPRGYSIDCYCCECLTASASFYADGFYAYAYAHKEARKAGWILHKDQYATCPECAEKIKTHKNKKS